MAKPKVEGTPTVGLIFQKWGLYRGDSLLPIHQLPVPGGKLWMGTKETLLVYWNIIFALFMSSQPWCDPMFETQSATHWFLQHLLVRPIVFYSTSNSIKTRLIKVGLGISRTNADSQWNPVYNVFHRNFCCGNETIRRRLRRRLLSAALLERLPQVCRVKITCTKLQMNRSAYFLSHRSPASRGFSKLTETWARSFLNFYANSRPKLPTFFWGKGLASGGETRCLQFNFKRCKLSRLWIGTRCLARLLVNSFYKKR